jgi:hypothetical protein
MSRYQGLTAAAMTMLILSASATAQRSDVDRAFTTTAASCDQIQWSQEALDKYPKIASACQDVMERDGRYYVKFAGTVRRVSGDNVTVNFKDGSVLTLTPPENMSLYIDGRPRTVRNLRRGDELTFYVPQENVTAPPPQVVGITVIPIQRIRVAQAAPNETAAADQPAQKEGPPLPATASVLPLVGLSGLVLTLIGILPVRRRPR